MPTVAVHRDTLFKNLQQEYTEEAFDNLCFEFGIELDDVEEDENGQVIYKLDIGANRYDLLCIQGITLALNTFRGISSYPTYSKLPAKEKMIVKPATAQVRPFVVAAILRDMTFTPSTYQNFMDLQDKLHQNICRHRKYASIGTHNLDTIKGPFVYDAVDPKSLDFVALKQTKSMTADKLLEHYEKNDMFLKPYVGLIKDSPVYPVIKDSNGVVGSLPPIINSEHSRITLDTKDVLIEVTGLDLTKSRIVLDTVCSLFSIYCKNPNSVECVDVIYEADPAQNATFPDLEYREMEVSADFINRRVGVTQTASDMAASLSKMGLSGSVKPDDDDKIVVRIPPTRSDILQACDVVEDAAVAFGFNNLPYEMPKVSTVGKQFQLNKLTDLLRNEIAQAGYTEALTFSLCSRDDVSKKIRKELANNVVHIGNPKTLEFQICRTTLVPGLLKTIASNRSLPLPIKIFEIQDTVEKTDENDVGSKNVRKLAAAYYSNGSGFENIVGLADRILQILEVKESDYFLRPNDNEMFFKGRSCELIVKGSKVGDIGVIHPEVVTNFELTCPLSVVEIDLDYFEKNFDPHA